MDKYHKSSEYNYKLVVNHAEVVTSEDEVSPLFSARF